MTKYGNPEACMNSLSGCFCLMLFFFFFLFPAHAQSPVKEDFFIAPLTEVLLYSPDTISFGGGFALGYGSGGAMGIRFLYAVDGKSYGIAEMLFFLRLYFNRSAASLGPFIQFNGGPVLFTYGGIGTARERIGTISAGLSAGWRFPLGTRWFVEPAVRAGYPYIAGAGISAGLRL